MRSTYAVPPYGLKVVFTDTVADFHRLRYHKGFDATGLSGAFDSGKVVSGVIGVFDGRITTLVHEAIHAAIAVLRECGINPVSNNGEPLAYLAEHLTSVGRQRLNLR